MNTADVLCRSVEHTHQNLATRLEGARTTSPTLAQPRKPYEDIDTFLAMASKHLGAVDAVLLPEVRKHVPEGGHLVHDYVHAEKELEIALAHVKARAYGSTYEAGHAWEEVWSDVDATLAGHRGAELALAGALTEALPPGELDDVTERLQNAESSAPTRPHPYAPHTGMAGSVSRKANAGHGSAPATTSSGLVTAHGRWESGTASASATGCRSTAQFSNVR